MENITPEPLALTADPDADDDLDSDFAEDSTRHDGWTGRRMAMFCAILAESGIVTDACHAVGMSTTSAYGARRRNPLFEAAWEESLALARDRLADALLERSLNGCVEKYYRDGELVGEKRILDNRLGMSILRRLDRMAETGQALHSNVRAGRDEPPAAAPDWDLMLSALRTGDEGMIGEALLQSKRGKTDEVGEVANPPNRPPSDAQVDEDDPPQRCWKDDDGDGTCWWTDFPPPSGFDGYEKGRWGDEDYKRICTAQELKALEAAFEAELAEERSEDEAARDGWFAGLAGARDTKRHPGLEPGPACSSTKPDRDKEPSGK